MLSPSPCRRISHPGLCRSVKSTPPLAPRTPSPILALVPSRAAFVPANTALACTASIGNQSPGKEILPSLHSKLPSTSGAAGVAPARSFPRRRPRSKVIPPAFGENRAKSVGGISNCALHGCDWSISVQPPPSSFPSIGKSACKVAAADPSGWNFAPIEVRRSLTCKAREARASGRVRPGKAAPNPVTEKFPSIVAFSQGPLPSRRKSALPRSVVSWPNNSTSAPRSRLSERTKA